MKYTYSFLVLAFLAIVLWIIKDLWFDKPEGLTEPSNDAFYLQVVCDDCTASDTLTLTWWPEYYSTIKRKGVPHQVLTAHFKESRFEFTIEDTEQPFYFTLTQQNKRRPLVEYMLGTSGDHVAISITNDSLKFFGQKALKYECQHLMKQQQQGIQDYFGTVIGSLTPDRFMTFYSRKYDEFDSLFAAQKVTLLAYAGHMDRDYQEVLMADLVGQNKYLKAYTCYQNLSKDLVGFFLDSTEAAQLKTAFWEMYQTRSPGDKGMSDHHKAQSRNYLQAILWDVRIQTLRSGSDDVLRYVDEQYEDVLKDKLLTTYILEKYEYLHEEEDYLRDLMMAIAHEPSKKILDQLAERGTGKRAYNFALPDANDSLISLHGFSGKVVLMNFWFTGCSGSEDYNQQVLTPIQNEYGANDQLVFVTISIDRDKERWLSSLANNKYTSLGMVNLWTGGKGSDHQLVRHYGISEYPTPLLIGSDGVINSINVERLRNAEQLKLLINDALRNSKKEVFL